MSIDFIRLHWNFSLSKDFRFNIGYSLNLSPPLLPSTPCSHFTIRRQVPLTCLQTYENINLLSPLLVPVLMPVMLTVQRPSSASWLPWASRWRCFRGLHAGWRCPSLPQRAGLLIWGPCGSCSGGPPSAGSTSDSWGQRHISSSCLCVPLFKFK